MQSSVYVWLPFLAKDFLGKFRAAMFSAWPLTDIVTAASAWSLVGAITADFPARIYSFVDL